MSTPLPPPPNVLASSELRRSPNSSPLVVLLLAAILGVQLYDRLAGPTREGPSPAVAVDSHFVRLGKSYLPALGSAYAAAWEDGAADLDAGMAVADSLDAVNRAWAANRLQLFGRLAVPEFGRIVPAGAKDAEVAPQQRAALAAAWRGFAAGLGGSKSFRNLPGPK